MLPMQVIVQVTQHAARPPLPLLHCPAGLAALMESCWQEDPGARPTFAELLPRLRALMQEARREQLPTAAERTASLGAPAAVSPQSSSGGDAAAVVATSPTDSRTLLLPPPAAPASAFELQTGGGAPG